jgi:putative ABC transport system permease protein
MDRIDVARTVYTYAALLPETPWTIYNQILAFMDNLVLANILYRKTRTIATIAGVSLGVVLVVLTVGISHGFLHDQGKRNSALTAEIMFGAPGNSFVFNLNPTLNLKADIAEQVQSIDGVAAVVPLGQYLKSFRLVDGVDFDAFAKASDARIVEGRAPASDDEAIVDRIQQYNRKLKLGDSIEVFDRQFKVVGIYEPESLGRVKVRLSAMQAFLNRPALCSFLLVKVSDPSKTDEVAARIKQRFPDNGMMLTRDLPIAYGLGTPALQTFLKVVIVLAIIVSSLVILLTMYTTVTERTRQIGVLKSLGASRLWIAGEIQKEALMISALGVLTGFALSLAGKYLIMRLTHMPVDLEPIWLFYALVVGMLAGVFGALYPALRAANQDPVVALSYE